MVEILVNGFGFIVCTTIHFGFLAVIRKRGWFHRWYVTFVLSPILSGLWWLVVYRYAAYTFGK